MSRQHSHVPSNNAKFTLKLFGIKLFFFFYRMCFRDLKYNFDISKIRKADCILCGDVKYLEMMTADEAFLVSELDLLKSMIISNL